MTSRYDEIASNLAIVQHDLSHGFIDFEQQKLRPKKLDFSGLNRLWSQSKARDFDSVILAQGPADTNYRFMAQHFFHFIFEARPTVVESVASGCR